jgi:hypothetical protein
VLVATSGVALAAPLAITSSRVGAGDMPVAHCDAGGFTHSFTTSRGNVTAVTVGGIADPACESGVVRVTVTNAAGDSIATAGPQTVAVDGDAVDNSATLATSPQPAAWLVAGTHIVVEGP